MPKNAVSDWSAVPGENEDIAGVVIGQATRPTDLDNIVQQIMAQAAEFTSSATIASGTTTDLSTTPESYINVTGATTITGLGTLRAGIIKVLRFSGAMILTHNATGLILPGAANITTVAGDVATFVSEGAGNWRCVGYSRAEALPALESDNDIAEIVVAEANNDAAIIFGLDTGGSFIWEIRFDGVRPQTDSASLVLEFSTDGGSNWVNSFYRSSGIAGRGEVSASLFNSNTGTYFTITDGQGNAAQRTTCGRVLIADRTVPKVSVEAVWLNSAGSYRAYTYTGQAGGAAGATHIRLRYSSGNIAQGRFVLIKHKDHAA